MITCEEVGARVRDAFQSRISVRAYEGGCEVSLPLLDPLNDYIRVYVIPTKEGIEISDYGMALEILRELGVEVDTPKREEIFANVLQTNGVKEARGVLTTFVSNEEGDFGRHLILFLRAVTALLDLEVMKEPTARLDFEGVVWQYLRERSIVHEHHVPIQIPSLTKPMYADFQIHEKVLMNTLHAGNVQVANGFINRLYVDFGQIRKFHSQKYKLATLYNDDSPVSESPRFSLLPEVLDFPPIPWSERDEGVNAILAEA